MNNSYNIVELPIINSIGHSSILFGKWTLDGVNLRFEGITIENGLVNNDIRDVINHTLSPNTLTIGNTLEINKRTYDVVVSWFQQLLQDINRCINEIPEIDDREQALVIRTDKNIIISPFGKELSDDNFVRSIIDDNIPEIEILRSSTHSDFPSLTRYYSYRNLDHYWDAMKIGTTRYISNTMCDMLICTITQKLNSIIQQIKYIHANKALYK